MLISASRPAVFSRISFAISSLVLVLSSLVTTYIVAELVLPPPPPISMDILDPLVMAPTFSTSSMDRIASTILSDRFPVSSSVASSARVTLTVSWVESMSDMNAVPFLNASAALAASSPTTSTYTRGFTFSAPLRSFS